MSLPDSATADAHLTETRDTETDVGSVFVSNYPPFSFWSPEHVPAAQEALDRPQGDAESTPDLGLYLHIPFCRKRCKFCYFRVYTDKNFDQIGSYLDAVAEEVEGYAKRPAIAGRKPRFVYIGGGTPSYISVKHLEALMGRLQAALPFDAVEEFTFECEPGTLTRSKLEAIRGVGVTRLSLGIENFDDEILRENGRAHETKEIRRCLPWVEELDFPQLNIDLIAGMVGESWDTWRETIRKTIDLGPDSVTIYQMELPFNTRYSRQVLEGNLEQELADWDTKRAWQDYAFEQLEGAGYDVSSAYTMLKRPEPGTPADRAPRFVYRDSVWNGCDLVGTGVASFSHVGGVHFQNLDGWGEYLAAVQEGRSPIGRALAVTAEQRLTRELILQLKLGEVDAGAFQAKFGADVREVYSDALSHWQTRGMLEVDGERIRLTRDGLLRVDTLLPEFYAPEHRNARYT